MKANIMENWDSANNKPKRRAFVAIISLTAALVILDVVFIALVIGQALFGVEAMELPFWLAFSALIAVMTGIAAVAIWFVVSLERKRAGSIDIE